MDSIKKIPHFSYDLSIHNRDHDVLANKKIFDHISSDSEFFRALGYTEDIVAMGMLPEEFIWDVYRRDGAPKTAQCLQAKIAGYLNNHSERFRTEYGDEYANIIGKCMSDNIDSSSICLECPMHPHFLPPSGSSLSSQ